MSKIIFTVKQAVFDRERDDKYVETRSVERLAQRDGFVFLRWLLVVFWHKYTAV